MKRNAPGFTIPEKDFRQGRKVTGPGTETSDSVPAALSKNEFVIKAKSAKRIGYDVLHHMNRTGEVPMRMKAAKRQPPGNGRLMLAIGGPARRQPPGNGRLKLAFGGVGTQRPDEPDERDTSDPNAIKTTYTPPSLQPKAPPYAKSPGGRSSEDMDAAALRDAQEGAVKGTFRSLGRKMGFGYSKGGKTGLRAGYASGGKAHPGFKAVAAKIGKQPGIRNPGAVLAAASRGASASAKRANPRLNRVK